MLYRITKFEYRDKKRVSEMVTLLLFFNNELVGYTHNLEQLTPPGMPVEKKCGDRKMDNFDFYYVELSKNEEVKYFSWKETSKGRCWVSYPDHDGFIQPIREMKLPELSGTGGYTLLIENEVMDKIFNLIAEKGNIRESVQLYTI